MNTMAALLDYLAQANEHFAAGEYALAIRSCKSGLNQSPAPEIEPLLKIALARAIIEIDVNSKSVIRTRQKIQALFDEALEALDRLKLFDEYVKGLILLADYIQYYDKVGAKLVLDQALAVTVNQHGKDVPLVDELILRLELLECDPNAAYIRAKQTLESIYETEWSTENEKIKAIDDVKSLIRSLRAQQVCSKCGSAQDPTCRLKKCCRCLQKYYCSRECQEADWKNHKAECQPPKA